MTMTAVTPSVWIGCLASYNAGRLIGKWVEATDLETMLEAQEEVKAEAIAAAKEAGEWPTYFTEPEEFFLADYEGFPRGTISEYTPLAKVAEIAEAVEEHGEAFEAFLSLGIIDLDDVWEAVEKFQEAYVGQFESLRDYAYEHVHEVGLGGVPAGNLEIGGGFYGPSRINVIESLENYIDWDKVARDLEQAYCEEDGYVFRRDV